MSARCFERLMSVTDLWRFVLRACAGGLSLSIRGVVAAGRRWSLCSEFLSSRRVIYVILMLGIHELIIFDRV